MSLFQKLLGTMSNDFLIGGPSGIMLRKVAGGFEVRNSNGSALEDLKADNLIANTSVKTDTINENTVDAGVTVDGVLIKDGLVDGKDVSTLAQDSEVVHLTGNETIAGVKTFSDGIKSDTIDEETLDAGVTVDGVLIKDGLVDGKDVSTLAQDADVIKKDGSVAFTANQSMNNNKLTDLATPTSANDAANKAYVDAVAQGIQPHASVRVATTVALDVTPSGSKVGKTLTANANGAVVIDGVTLVVGDRVLVKNQATATHNGIYEVTTVGDGSNPFVLTRTASEDGVPNVELAAGDFFFVTEGNANADSGFVITEPAEGLVDVDVTNINFTQFSGAGQIEAGNGLSKTGNVLDVNVDGSTLEINADALRIKDAGVVEAKIANNAVTTDKVNNDAITKDKINSDVAGNGLGQNVDGSLEVNVDGSTLEINADALRVKDLGISTGKLADDSVTKDKINSDVAGNGLGQNVDGSLEVNVDDTTIEIVTDTLQIKDSAITDAKVSATANIAWTKISKTGSSLADLATRNYSDLTGRPADDDFHTLTEETTIANDDELLIYDASATAYRKMQRSNVIAGLALDNAVVHLTGNETISGIKDFSDSIKVDTINEHTAGAGVTVDGLLIKDGVIPATGVDLENATELTSVDNADSILIYDSSADANRRITRSNFLSGIALSQGLAKHIKVDVTTSDASSTTAIPANAIVKSVVANVNEAYSAGATIQVVIDGTVDLEVMATADNDATVQNTYKADPYATVGASNTGVVKVVVGGTPVAGASEVIVEYVEQFLA